MNSPIGKKDDSRPPGGPDVADAGAADERRVAARRRFLKGAGGSAAMVVTVTHRRAIAGVKKGAVYSACVSLQGTPDMKGMDKKNPLETSGMGTPKGLVCYPKGTAPKNCTISPDEGPSEYLAPRTAIGPYVRAASDKDNTLNFTKVMYWEDGLKKGCGDLKETVDKSYAYRLYQKGYCPVVFDANGDLTLDTTAKYYERKGCDPSKDSSCISTPDDKDPTKEVTLKERDCE